MFILPIISLLLIKLSKAAENGLPTIKMPQGRSPIVPPICGFSAIPCTPNPKYRRLDASCTNPNVPHWGMAGDLYTYILQPQDDVLAEIFNHKSARDLRTYLFPTDDSASETHTLFFMIFGQFIAHDNSMLIERETGVCCSSLGQYQANMNENCAPIDISVDDAVFAKDSIHCMNFTRVQSDHYLSCNKNPFSSPINTVTSFLDLSPVYGNNENECLELRSSGGYLKTKILKNVEHLPTTKAAKRYCKVKYVTGDSRANQNPSLIATHTIFVKEHNRIVKKLSEINAHWDEEKLFWEARKILIAIYQHIVFYNWLPVYLNEERLYSLGILYNTTDFVNDFDSNVSPAVSSEYAHAAFRSLHMTIPNKIELYTPKLRILFSNTELSKNLFCQDQVENPGILEAVNVGMITQKCGKEDTNPSKSIADNFSGGKYGMDVISIDIQRGRDVRLHPYTKYKKEFGFGETTNFLDLMNLIDEISVNKLQQMYETPQQIDLFVGGVLEKKLTNAFVGPTFHRIIEDQFLRFRKSDYFFYESQSGGLTLEQLNNIREVSSIKNLLCKSAVGISTIQRNPFYLTSSSNNPALSCESQPDLDWSLWIDNST